MLLNGSDRLTAERPEKKRKLDEHSKSQSDESPALQTMTLASRNLDGSKSTGLEGAYSIIKAESSAMVQLTVCLVRLLNAKRSRL